MDAAAGSYRFDRFAVNRETGQLLVDGRPAALGSRAFEVLLALIERRDRVVTKNELLDVVWPGLVVEENNLQVQVSALRKLLGPQAIATIPGRGYRFTAPIDVAAHPARQSAPAAGVPAPSREPARAAFPGNLPAEVPRLFGRDADVATLRALVEAHRMVTVVGAGGIGKSRLAQAAAHSLLGRWPDGVWMVELAGLGDPALLPNVIAQTLHITLPGNGPVQDELAAALAQRSLLLVVDNCEHLLDAAAAMTQAIIAGAPDVRLLATSQEPLHLPDEQQFRVMPLAIPPAQAEAASARTFGAIALFEARVRAADSRFALNDQNLPLAIDICRQLDGLPLAIELAAARVSTLGLLPVRDKLDARFKLLTGGTRTTLRRHQTLRAALEWSHNLLNEAERAVFRRLGVFAGGFTIETAQAVAADDLVDDWAVLDHLSALVDKSLVVADAGEVPRYRLLESARAFALEQLAAGETALTLRRHALAMRRFLERVDGLNLDGELRTDQYAALVLPELDNLRAAHAWATGEPGDRETALALAGHAGSLIDYAIECADWLPPLIAQAESPGIDRAVAARYWRALAASNMTGHVPRALQLEAANRAKVLYEALGMPRRVFSSLIQMARRIPARDNDAVRRAVLEEARALIRPGWPPEFRILLLRLEATIAMDGGRLDEALRLFEESARASKAASDWRLQVIAGSNLLNILWLMGLHERAADEALKFAGRLRDRPAADPDAATLFANAMGILSEMGRVGEALAIARFALPVMQRARAFYIESWAYMYWRRGQFDIAATLLGFSDGEVRRTGMPLQVNERRIIAEARKDLAAKLPKDVFESHLAAGATLDSQKVHALLAAGLASDP